MKESKIIWILAGEGVRDAKDEWLGRFFPANSSHALHPVVSTVPDDSSRKRTDYRRWLGYLGYTRQFLAEIKNRRAHGVVALFPQTAAAIALRNLLVPKRWRVSVVAWHFNLGTLPQGWRRRVASIVLREVDVFVVHSRLECEVYARWFDLPVDRFVFVPLQAPERHVTESEDAENPFVIAMGTARRDYGTLFAALAQLDYRAIVIAGQHAVDGLTRPGKTEIRQGLSREACFSLLQQARLHVIPLSNDETASGQVTLVESMSHRKATIVTRCGGTVDYARDGIDALFVNPADTDDMVSTMRRVWTDENLRSRLGAEAQKTARETYSDAATAKRLDEILTRLVEKRAS